MILNKFHLTGSSETGRWSRLNQRPHRMGRNCIQTVSVSQERYKWGQPFHRSSNSDAARSSRRRSCTLCPGLRCNQGKHNSHDCSKTPAHGSPALECGNGAAETDIAKSFPFLHLSAGMSLPQPSSFSVSVSDDIQSSAACPST